MMNIVWTKSAEKHMNRYKNIGTYDIEDIVNEDFEKDDVQCFMDECETGFCSEIYDSANDITIFTEVNNNHDECTIVGVRRGDVR